MRQSCDVATGGRRPPGREIDTQTGFCFFHLWRGRGAHRISCTVAAMGEGRALTVFTLASQDFISMLRNWVRHMAIELPEQSFEAHATDSATFAACRGFVYQPGVCVHSPFNVSSEKDRAEYYATRFYAHKVAILLTVLQRSSTVIMLDATALIGSASCFDQWKAYQEDIVTSASMTDPPDFARAFGQVANTGAILIRATARELVGSWLEGMQKNRLVHGDQRHFNRLLTERGFAWANVTTTAQQGRVGSIRGWRNPAREEGTNTIRFLPLLQWPRQSNRSAGKCLYHPFVHTAREEIFARDGWWHADSSDSAALPHRAGRCEVGMATRVSCSTQAFDPSKFERAIGARSDSEFVAIRESNTTLGRSKWAELCHAAGCCANLDASPTLSLRFKNASLRCYRPITDSASAHCENQDPECRGCKACKDSEQSLAPNAVHFVWVGDLCPPPSMLLSLSRAALLTKPDTLNVWLSASSSCDATAPVAQCIAAFGGQLRRMEPPANMSIAGMRRSSSFATVPWQSALPPTSDTLLENAPKRAATRKTLLAAHESDVARLYILNRLGGMYLDADAVLVRALHRWRSCDFVMGTDSPFAKLNNGLMVSRPDSAFGRQWWANLSAWTGRGWDMASCSLPFQLCLNLPHQVAATSRLGTIPLDWRWEGTVPQRSGQGRQDAVNRVLALRDAVHFSGGFQMHSTVNSSLSRAVLARLLEDTLRSINDRGSGRAREVVQKQRECLDWWAHSSTLLKCDGDLNLRRSRCAGHWA